MRGEREHYMNPEIKGGSRLFGTDGVRGKVNSELTPELALLLGRAAVRVLARESPRPLLVLGRDTRLSGGMLEAALVAGICSSGGRVELLGVIPTPAVAYLARSRGADAGVVISASHNPAEDNGIKFFHRDGFKLPDEVEAEMERFVSERHDFGRPRGDAVGSYRQVPDAEEEYLRYLLSIARPDLSSLRVVVDCAHGAAYRVAPRMLESLGADVVCINASPDGLNINRECGSTHCSGLQREVVEKGAYLGLAFDGDADRLIAVDEEGHMVDGDFILAVCALNMKDKGMLKKNAVVTTVMANLGFHRAMRRADIEVHVTQVGDRHVLERMLGEGNNLGGEQSGHIIFLDHATTGDGLVTTLMLMEAVVEHGGPLSSLARVVEKVPQLLIDVPVKEKEGLGENKRIAEAVRVWEEKLGDEGRVLLRPSGTEPVVRVMVEALAPDVAEQAARQLADLVERELG